MADRSDNLILVCCRRLDAKMAVPRDDVTDLKERLTTLDVQVGHLAVTGASHYVQTALRLDRMDGRLERHACRADILPA